MSRGGGSSTDTRDRIISLEYDIELVEILPR
jgi:hypothetical protein